MQTCTVRLLIYSHAHTISDINVDVINSRRCHLKPVTSAVSEVGGQSAHVTLCSPCVGFEQDLFTDGK